MASWCLLTIWAIIFFISATSAQDSTIEMLDSNPTVGRGQTVTLRVELPLGLASGMWIFDGRVQVPDTENTRYSVVGRYHQLTFSNIQDSNAGFYGYFSSGNYVTGTVTVVPAVDGGFGNWTDWVLGSCSVSCGTGRRMATRSRECDNPSPKYGGKNCSGLFQETSTSDTVCNPRSCPGGSGTTTYVLANNPTLTTGTTVRLQVIATEDFPLGTWLFNNNPLPNDGRTTPSVNGMIHELTIRNVQTSDAGSYAYFSLSMFESGEVSVIEEAEVSGVCETAEDLDEIGYRYHPTDCDKYIQCYKNNPNGNVMAVYRTCPFGYYWSQVTYRCDEPWEVECPVEKCNGSCGKTYKIAGSCGSYWDCGYHGAEAKCCSPGLSYYPGKGCRRNWDCEDVCPSPYAMTRDRCMKRPNYDGDSNTFEIFAGALGWQETTCPGSTVFDVLDCGCMEAKTETCNPSRSLPFDSEDLPSWATGTGVTFSTGAAMFDNTTQMTLDVMMMPSDYPLVLRIRYAETATGDRVLVSSKDDRYGNTFVLTSCDDGLEMHLKAWNNDVNKMTLSTAGIKRTEYKFVTVKYDGRYLVAVVEAGSIKNVARIYAPGLTFMENGLRIGSDGSEKKNKRFIGSIDSVNIYTCIPGNLY